MLTVCVLAVNFILENPDIKAISFVGSDQAVSHHGLFGQGLNREKCYLVLDRLYKMLKIRKLQFDRQVVIQNIFFDGWYAVLV